MLYVTGFIVSFIQNELKTISKILKNIHVRMAEHCEQNSVFEKGKIEMDESYFGPRKIRGKKD